MVTVMWVISDAEITVFGAEIFSIGLIAAICLFCFGFSLEANSFVELIAFVILIGGTRVDEYVVENPGTNGAADGAGIGSDWLTGSGKISLSMECAWLWANDGVASVVSALGVKSGAGRGWLVFVQKVRVDSDIAASAKIAASRTGAVLIWGALLAIFTLNCLSELMCCLFIRYLSSCMAYFGVCGGSA